VFNTVGITSGVGSISPPAPLVGQPELTGTSSTGATLPEVLYVGAEYCPYCAAERWSTIIALSRFGTFTGLGNTVVPSTEAPYGGVTSFTFLKTTFKSKYLVFNAVERYTNIPDPATHFYTPLQKMNKIEKANFKKYDNSKYIPGISASQTGAIPYINYANRFVSAGSSFSPSLLENLTRSQIAVGLSSASSPITQAIIATANYQSAIICSLTNNQPGSVCSSPGVMLAKKSLKIK
jgi:hypothetical protein